MDLAEQVAGIGALADPVRRALYQYVTAQSQAVGREAAAAAVRVPVHTAKFHLDRLCDEGLLQAEFRRLSGRTGPGAGRPAKLYRRADRQFSVSLPERRYDLVAHILATAVQRAAQGTPLADALHGAAYEEGRHLGTETSTAGPDLARLAQALATQGFEPRIEDGVLVLANCPFDSLVREHASLICSLNESYVQGAVDGLGCVSVRADLAPVPGMCCVQARSATPPLRPRRSHQQSATFLARWGGLHELTRSGRAWLDGSAADSPVTRRPPRRQGTRRSRRTGPRGPRSSSSSVSSLSRTSTAAASA